MGEVYAGWVELVAKGKLEIGINEECIKLNLKTGNEEEMEQRPGA